jgi:hypothetical protein
LEVLDLPLDLAAPLLALELPLSKRLLTLCELAVPAFKRLLPGPQFAFALSGKLRD